MAKMKLVLNKQNVRRFAKSEGMQGAMDQKAEAVRNAAGEGFIVVKGKSRNRARAVVLSTTGKAVRAEQTDRVLTRAIDAAVTR